ncbi:sigma-70 region 4 domain-containing protein [Paludibacterium paludis]|uniref:RNA polymerase sigma factor 70 region 4 type 2 domain-containing protein n=1 Tax=Paludibacterium paludis TaxID=1225769 RepID=A0A918NY71_9NEIS|nr:sigma-70 region 4 domain-containing protein [Paludibacterium paludis]GGY06438.1 hypothetical protein GCM10011289_06180 [Paludibacterium paludis]
MKLAEFNRLVDSLGLNPRAREAVRLMEIEGMTCRSAACQLDISLSTVSRAHSRFCRAACTCAALIPLLHAGHARQRARPLR